MPALRVVADVGPGVRRLLREPRGATDQEVRAAVLEAEADDRVHRGPQTQIADELL